MPCAYRVLGKVKVFSQTYRQLDREKKNMNDPIDSLYQALGYKTETNVKLSSQTSGIDF